MKYVTLYVSILLPQNSPQLNFKLFLLLSSVLETTISFVGSESFSRRISGDVTLFLLFNMLLCLRAILFGCLSHNLAS